MLKHVSKKDEWHSSVVSRFEIGVLEKYDQEGRGARQLHLFFSFFFFFLGLHPLPILESVLN